MLSRLKRGSCSPGSPARGKAAASESARASGRASSGGPQHTEPPSATTASSAVKADEERRERAASRIGCRRVLLEPFHAPVVREVLLRRRHRDHRRDGGELEIIELLEVQTAIPH